LAETTIFRGDRVMFHKPDRSRGIENGYCGTVLQARWSDQLVIRLDREPSRSRSGLVVIRQVVTLTVRDVAGGRFDAGVCGDDPQDAGQHGVELVPAAGRQR
jgi:hypothetical protein